MLCFGFNKIEKRKRNKKMLEPWNDKSVLPPPVNTYICKSKGIDINNLRHICKSIIHVLSKQSPLHKESAILSRFLYKYDKKFRNDIGYRYFKKVNTALRKYLGLAMIKVVQNFIDILPSVNETTKYAPTRQMLEYVLIRMITFSKLMARITQCSKQAAIFYLNRIKKGESHWMCLMPYALLSRLWSMSYVLLQHSCNWYKQLHPLVQQLEYKGLNFLPNGHTLPSSLEDLNDMKYINNAGRFEWLQKISINFDSTIAEDEDGELCENILKFVDKINKNNHNELEPQFLLSRNDTSVKEPPLISTEISEDRGELTSRKNLKKSDDQGEVLSRDSFSTYMNNLPPILSNPSVHKIRQDHQFENVVDRHSLKEFLDNEESYRNTSDNKSLTSHLAFLQWQALKNGLSKFDSDLVNNNKLKIKVRKLWREKCLDYL